MFGKITLIGALMILTGMVFASFKSFHTSDFAGPAIPESVALRTRVAPGAGSYAPPPAGMADTGGAVTSLPAVPTMPPRSVPFISPGRVQIPQMSTGVAPQPDPDDNSSTDNNDNNDDNNNNNDNNDNNSDNDNNSMAEPPNAPRWYIVERGAAMAPAINLPAAAVILPA